MKTQTSLCRIFYALCLCACMTLVACATTPPPLSIIEEGGRNPPPIENFREVEKGRIYRGAQPIENGQRDDWAYLQKLGIKTVLKLNRYSSIVTEESEIASAKRHGIEVHEILMNPEDFPHNWDLWAMPTASQIDQAISFLQDEKNGKIFVHCSHGKDRTGLVVAMYRLRSNNYCISKAAEEMDSYGANPWLFNMKKVLLSKKSEENPSCIK